MARSDVILVFYEMTPPMKKKNKFIDITYTVSRATDAKSMREVPLRMDWPQKFEDDVKIIQKKQNNKDLKVIYISNTYSGDHSMYMINEHGNQTVSHNNMNTGDECRQSNCGQSNPESSEGKLAEDESNREIANHEPPAEQKSPTSTTPDSSESKLVEDDDDGSDKEKAKHEPPAEQKMPTHQAPGEPSTMLYPEDHKNKIMPRIKNEETQPLTIGNHCFTLLQRQNLNVREIKIIIGAAIAVALAILAVFIW